MSSAGLKVLVYSEGLSGHRQLYCDVLTDILLELGCRVFLAVGLSRSDKHRRWNHIERYSAHPGVEIMDICKMSASGRWKLSVAEIVALQRQEGIQVTLFPCGDELRQEFTDIALKQAPRLHSRNVAVVGPTDDTWFSKEEDIPRPQLTLQQRLRRAKNHLLYPAQRERDRRADVRFFYEHVLGRTSVLDCVLVKDERFAEARGRRFIWFPEIYKPFKWDDTEEAEEEYRTVVPAYKDFLRRQQGREVLLYFGRADAHKGYDRLMALAVIDESTCFVHCGARDDDSSYYDTDVRLLRETLRDQERLFETQRFIVGQRTIGEFFNSIQRFVSTHRLIGSSGTVLQALDAGKPVLLPHRGFFRDITLLHGIGSTYQVGDLQYLLNAWQEFKKRPPQEYSGAIQRYMSNFTRDRLVNVVAQALGVTTG